MADGPEQTIAQLVAKLGKPWTDDVVQQRNTLIGLLPNIKGADFVQVQQYLQVTGNAPSDSARIVQTMIEEREFARKPYKDRRHEETSMRTLAIAKSIEQARASVAELAAHQTLSMEDVMSLSYSVFGDAEACRVQASIWARSGFERIRSHNFYVAQGNDENWWTMYGPVLMVLPYPLFPMFSGIKEINALNTTILRHCEEELSSSKGGEGKFTLPPKVFRENTKGGDYAMPVVNDQYGRAIVNATEIQAYCQTLQSQVTELRNQVNTLRGGRPQRPTTPAGRTPSSAKQCFKCRRFGHISRDCPDVKSDGAGAPTTPRASVPTATPGPRGKQVKCGTCGGEGTHITGCSDF